MRKNKSNQHWLKAQNKDRYVQQAKAAHYRSRAVYKLQEIDQQDKLIRPHDCVVDLGAAPGSWSQYASQKVGQDGRVIAVDRLPMKSVYGVSFILGDFADEAVATICIAQIGNQAADLVISDMAPNITGIRASDQANSMALAELVYNFCNRVLKPGGHLLVKLFEGAGTKEYRQLLKQHFAKIMIRKPRASRAHSREFYLLAHCYHL